jgi:hypothetical protein
MKKTGSLKKAQEKNERNQAMADKAQRKKHQTELANLTVEYERRLRNIEEERKLEGMARKMGLMGVDEPRGCDRRNRMGLDEYGESDEHVLCVNLGVQDFRVDPLTIEAADTTITSDNYFFNMINDEGCLNLKEKGETDLGLGGRPPKYDNV